MTPIILMSDFHSSTLNQKTDGQARNAYCPFGSYHPQLRRTLSGFNGQLSEPFAHTYALGNGYRSFNTVLRRFQSPDALSPFLQGGINTYAYCSGDPINRLDPTGHSFWSSLIGFFSRSSSDTVEAGLRAISKKPTGMSKTRKITDQVFAIENKKTLTIFGHGSKKPGHLIKSPAGNMSIPDLHSKMIETGVNFENFSQIHMISCYSANGVNSNAQALSALTKMPVIGYKGPVRGYPSPEDVQRMISKPSLKPSKQGVFNLKSKLTLIRRNPYKVNQPEWGTFQYAPHFFY